VETAIVLPLLLLVIFGLIDFGRMLNAQIVVTEAAREAARVEALGGDANDAKDLGRRAAQSIGAVKVYPEQTCDTSKDAQFRVAYTFSFVTPVGSLVTMFGGSGFGGDVTLNGRAVMPCQ
jgi:Flp pilus assembly protein TadG